MSFASRVDELKKLRAYSVLDVTEIPEIAAVGVTMSHEKTKARLYLLLSDDHNKVFYIGFRTPSQDSTGVAHIIEHTVLCGSEKYPSKDPFVELVKGSLNTFLNAMTYPDKTVYPVASCNDKDFKNLSDVYMDAVLNPNIYKEEKIFKQEGWHYELDCADGELTYNGVVYNEMKGVYSSADGVMERGVNKILFDGHPYAEESGGDPDNIPELTYQNYLDFHRRYYHPSNSYIYLYGDADMVERLQWLDEQYLSKYDELKVDSSLPPVREWEAGREAVIEYPISDSESSEHATYLSLHTLVGGECDAVMCAAMQVLDYVLLDVPGAPLREALIDAGIGDDILGGYEYGISEPYFSVIAKGAEESQKDEFISIVKTTLKKLSEEGLDKQSLLAAINISEFKAREADFGSYPKGLMYGLDSLNTWLYDGDPSSNLKFESIFDTLKKSVSENYFENLISEYLLDRKHEACIVFIPVKGLAEKKEEQLRNKLAGIKAGLDAAGIQKIIDDTAALKAYQSEPSSPEDLMKIPMLTREDIETSPEKLIYKKTECGQMPMLYHDVFTSGIAYIQLLFRTDGLAQDELPYLALLKEVLGYADTERYTYAQLSTEINLHTGGVSFNLEDYENCNNQDDYTFVMGANVRALYDEIPWSLDILREILLTTKLTDTKRLREILMEVKAKAKDKLLSAGHITAYIRSSSHDDKGRYFEDATKGITYYRFLEEATTDYDKHADKIAAKLQNLVSRLFTQDNMLYNLTCDSQGRDRFVSVATDYARSYPEHSIKGAGYRFVPDTISEAYTAASQVSYVARTGDITRHGYAYRGELQILKVLLSYDYLWNRVRVLGGAYGCSAQFMRSGKVAFSSYRDPQVADTDKIYDGIVDYIKNYDADEREMTKAIIGAISNMDTPQTPYIKGVRGTAAYFCGVTNADMIEERREILSAGAKEIRALAPMVEAALSDEQRCVIGNEGKIKEASDIYTSIKPLYTR